MSKFIDYVEESFWQSEFVTEFIKPEEKDEFKQSLASELKKYENFDKDSEEDMENLIDCLTKFFEARQFDFVHLVHAPQRIIDMALWLQDIDNGPDKDKGKKIWLEEYVRFSEMDFTIGRKIYDYFQQYPNETIGAAEDGDINVIEMAVYFSEQPAFPESDEDADFLDKIKVDWEYEQRHMVGWFMGQITLGFGAYKRGEPNFSFKKTWSRLRNPYSLMWIAFVLGVERKHLLEASQGCEEKTGNLAGQCAAVRKAIPFDMVYELAEDQVAKLF